jgi:hypothetical protein
MNPASAELDQSVKQEIKTAAPTAIRRKSVELDTSIVALLEGVFSITY